MLPYGKAFEQFTQIEQWCIRKTAQKQTTKWEKEQAYIGILERTMSTAKTSWEFDDERNGRIAKAEGVRPSQVLTAAALKQQAMGIVNQQFDKAYLVGTLQQHAQYEMQRAQVYK